MTDAPERIDLDEIEARLKRFHSTDPKGPTGTAFTLLEHVKRLNVNASDIVQRQTRRIVELKRRAEAAEAKLATAKTAFTNIKNYIRNNSGADWDNVRAFCKEALAQIEQPQETQGREQRVAEWVITRIGAAHMQSRERTMRGLEEAIEWAQAEGITSDQVLQQVAHVFARPPGDPKQEAAGVAVCLLAWCAANHTTFAEMADQEIARIEAKPIGQIRGSVARKTDADLVVVVEQPQEPEPQCQVKQ